MSSQPRPQQNPKQPTPVETPDEAAARWRFWRRTAVFSLAGIALIYLAWAYLVPWLHPRLFPVKLPDEVSIEELVADFNDDPAAAAKKYENRRIVVAGKLVVQQANPKEGKPSAIYFELPGGNGETIQVPVEFFDADDAGTVDPGDQVSLSGLIKREGSGKLRFVGAGRMPDPQ